MKSNQRRIRSRKFGKDTVQTSRCGPAIRRSLLFVAMVSALGMSMPALSQSESAEGPNPLQTPEDERVSAEQDSEVTDEHEDDRITVTGFRRAVERSVATRRDESSIVESVFAEEIGKLPDVSIAEALARLPGLTAQRVDGRAQTISVRGLGPDFSTALFNGREQVTTGDNRGVEFDQFPAELLNSVLVYKTPAANIIGQGLAGTVDLRTIRPLEADERIFSVVGRFETLDGSAANPEADDDGYRFAGIYVDQFFNNTLGVTFGVAAQSTPFEIERSNAWGFPDIGDGETRVLGGVKPFVQNNDLERIGFIGTVEYAPTDNFRAILDLSYSDFDEKQFLRGIEFPMFWSPSQLRDGFTVADNLVAEGVFDEVHAVMRNDFNRRQADIFTFGLNTRWEFAPLWGFESDLSWSAADREDLVLESMGGTGLALSGTPDSVGFTIAPNGIFSLNPTLNYMDPGLIRLTDPQGWGAGAQPNPLVQAGFINNPKTEDWLARTRFDIDRELVSGPLSKFSAGFALSRRDKDRQLNQSFLTPPDGLGEAAIPDAARVGGNVSLDFVGVPGMVLWDPRYLLDNFYTLVSPQVEFRKQQEWRVREDVLNTYFQFDLDTMIGGTIPLRGNFGAQWVVTDQSSRGFQVQPGEAFRFGDVEEGDTFSRFLPSANLVFGLPHDQQVRISAARVMARPRMDQLNAGLALNTNFTQLTSTDPNQAFFSAGGGNPNLRPMMADSVDVAWEKFFANGAGLVSITGFYKDLNDFVNPNDAFLTDFSQFIDDFLTPEQAAQLGTSMGTTFGPTNRGGGWIRGVDFAATVPFGEYFEPLRGFGYTGGVSYTDSSLKLGDSPDPVTVPGLSEWVVNTTLFYERRGFQARISNRYRDDFLSEIFGVAADRLTRQAKSEMIWDAQIGYEFQSGPVQGLTLTLQALNLGDEPFITVDENDLVIDRQKFGRNFLFGASYRF
ncbi:MAG: TonB-dependent receptor [Wenzhouxiangella sp.]